MNELLERDDRIECAGPQNPAIKLAAKLLRNSGANPGRLFVAEGLWAMKKIVEYGVEVRIFIFCPELIHSHEAQDMTARILNKSARSITVSDKVFKRLSERDNSDGLLAVAKLPHFGFDDIPLRENNLVVVLDGLEIPGNIGTIIRSVDGAGGDGVILVNRKVRLGHPKLIKGSIASSLRVPVIDADMDRTEEWLRINGFTIYLTDTRASCSYYQTDYRGRVAIVAGNEKHGIPRIWYESPHRLISIPMFGRCDSLNVGVATSIVAYEACLRHRGNNRRAAGTSSIGSPHSVRRHLLSRARLSCSHALRGHVRANMGIGTGFPPWARDSEERKATAVHSAAV